MVIAAFLHAGPMKADPRLAWLRVDLTLICAALLAVMLVASLVRDALRIAGDQILWSLCFLGLMLPGVLLAPVSAYAKEKSLFLVTLTLLAFMAGLVAGQRSRGLERLVMWLVMFSLLITGDALLKVATGAATLERVSGFSGTTITLGRAAGLVFLVEAAQFLLWPGRVRRQWLNLALATPAAAGVLFSGSKGPLLSALLALVVGLLIVGRPQAFLRLGLLGGIVGLGLVFAWSLIPSESLGRMTTFFSGQFGDSETTRWLALKKALPLIATHPLGIGWGGFAGQLFEWAQDGRQYVHNLVVELFLEGGWVTGTGFILLAVRSWISMRERARRDERILWAGLMLYTLFNALVSGDVNDNRMFFVLLGFGLGCQAFGQRLGSPAELPAGVTLLVSQSGPCESSI